MTQVLASLVLILVLSPNVQTSPWRAGVAVVKITPIKPVQMSGYASRTKPYESVHDDINAKALALEDGARHRAVIITTDLIGFTPPVSEPVCQEIASRAGIQRKDVLITAIHTHSAPTLSLNPDVREGFTKEDAANTVEYTRSLQKKLVDVALAALGRLEPARLSMGAGVENFVMNRRESTPTGVILGVNPRGPVDRSVPVIRVENADGKLIAALFGCACHNTTLGDKNMQLSGDYGGFAQRTVEEQNPGAVAMLMLGLAGDANPYPRGTMAMAHDHGTALGTEVTRVLGSKLKSINGPLTTVLENVNLPLTVPPQDELEKLAAKGPSYKQGVAKGILDLQAKRERPPDHYSAPIVVWQFGNDLTLVALSGEVVVDYALLLERALGPLDLWLAAYANDVYGYLPSKRVIEEGGYETRGTYYGAPGFFSPRAQDSLIKAVLKLARKAGRKLPNR